MIRSRVLAEIESLDPQHDARRITFLTALWEFPFETQRALEMAMVRTFAVPRMSALLAETGHFQRNGQKRYDDTTLLLSEIAEHGYDSERGRAALRRMNQMHGRFPIRNEDFIYVLSTFVFEPIRWNRLLGWRPLTEKEKLATYYVWLEIAKRMNIQNVPPNYAALERFNVDYEREHFAYAASNRQVADAAVQVYVNWFPSFLAPLTRAVVYALMDEPLLQAFGYPRQPSWFVGLVRGALRARAWIMRGLPRRRRPYLHTQEKNRTYPHGYEIDELGVKS